MEERIKSLRAHINDYENKVADIGLEQFRQQKSLQSKQKELQFLNDEVKLTRSQSEEVKKRAHDISCLLAKARESLATLEINSSSLSQALAFLSKEHLKRLKALNEKKLENQKCSAELNARAQQHQAFYDTLSSGKADSLETTPVTQNDQGAMTTDELKLQQGMQAELDILKQSCEKKVNLIEEANCSLQALLDKCLQYPEAAQLLDQSTLSQAIKSMEDEKNAEKEYSVSLQLRVEQIKDIREELICSCGHSYVVKV